MTKSAILSYAQVHLAAELQLMQTGGYAAACPMLTAAEKALIYHYTNTGSRGLNVPLYQGHANTTSLGQGLLAALAQLPAHVGQVYSAAQFDSQALLALRIRAASGGSSLPLDVIRWPAFLSTSKAIKVAKQHLNYGPKNCLLFISSRQGRDVEMLSHYGPNGPDPMQNEREVLFSPGTRFEVVAVNTATPLPEIELLEL